MTDRVPLLSIDNLTITYNPGAWNERTVLQGASLSVSEGDFIVLTGPNGSGKSSLLRALSGDLEGAEVSGGIFIEGQTFRSLSSSIAQVLAVIDQDPGAGTCEHLTVTEHLKLLNNEVSRQVRERLEQTGSTISLEQRVNSLSGGQRQLLATLVAVERHPKLLLADEPTAALDVHFAPLVSSLLQERTGKPGRATLMVTHEANLAIDPQVRRIRIENGQLFETESI